MPNAISTEPLASSPQTETVVIYPSMISRAVTLVDEDPFLRVLPHTVWPVLFRLIKKINVNNLSQPIFASRETLAKEAGESIANLSRQLRTLEDAGVITRNLRMRPGRRGSSSEILFTPKAIRALRLDSPPPSELKTPVFKAVKDEESGGVKYVRTEMIKIGKIRLPLDLAVLVTKGGMHATGVLKLMQVAKKAGQRLSEVVKTVEKYTTDFHGGKLFAYLKAVCLGKRNIASERAAQVKAEKERAERERIDASKRALEEQNARAQNQKTALLKSLTASQLERLHKLWMAFRGQQPRLPAKPEPERIVQLMFKTWLRSQSDAFLVGAHG